MDNALSSSVWLNTILLFRAYLVNMTKDLGQARAPSEPTMFHGGSRDSDVLGVTQSVPMLAPWDDSPPRSFIAGDDKVTFGGNEETNLLARDNTSPLNGSVSWIPGQCC